MILTHSKKEKVNSWSMATLDKLSWQKKQTLAVGVGHCLLEGDRIQELWEFSIENCVIQLCNRHFLRSPGILEKCHLRLYFISSVNTINFLLMNLSVFADPGRVWYGRCLYLKRENLFWLANFIPMFSCKIYLPWHP